MCDENLLDPVTSLICECTVPTYDPKATDSVRHFREISQQTHCMFAKKASTWGSCDWDGDISLEENVRRSLPALRCFVLATTKNEVDIFVVEVVGEGYFSSLDEFCRTVWRVLKVISDDDPKIVHALDDPLAGQTDKGWIMSYCGLQLFVLTFCPLYPATHSRYMFGTNPGSCFLLLQGGSAFNEVGEFTLSADVLSALPHFSGLSDRDRIRGSFLRAGCPFNVDHAHCVVRPLDDFADEEPRWWDQHESVSKSLPVPQMAEPSLVEDASLDELLAAEFERERRASHCGVVRVSLPRV